MIIGTPHTRNAGYFCNDKDLKTRQEADIRTCPHCQAIIKMQEWSKAPTQNFCMQCFAPACNRPECLECVPFLKKLEAHAEQLEKFRKVGLILG